jgi:hypothetical protein
MSGYLIKKFSSINVYEPALLGCTTVYSSEEQPLLQRGQLKIPAWDISQVKTTNIKFCVSFLPLFHGEYPVKLTPCAL